MAEYRDETIIDPDDPRAVRRETVVAPSSRPFLGPWLVLLAIAFVAVILALMFANRENTTTSVVESTGTVLGTQVTPTTITVDSTTNIPPPIVQGQPAPAVERTQVVPGPTRTVTEQIPVPGPTRTVTQTVPGPTRTVTQTIPAPAPATGATGTDTTAGGGAEASPHSSIALGTQVPAYGRIVSVASDQSSLTIDHRDVTGTQLKAGTDTFKLRDAALLQDLRPGETVEFTLQRTEGGWEVVELSRVRE